MNDKINLTSIKTSIGEFYIGVYKNSCCLLDFKYRKIIKRVMNRIAAELNADYVENPHPLHDEIEHELNAYLKGELVNFTIPLITAGTQFQKKVWDELRKIPYGETISYKELATRIGNPKSIRAVGGANGSNGISIIIPCHRVINANGDLQGYGGGLRLKKKLLDLEKKQINTIEEWF